MVIYGAATLYIYSPLPGKIESGFRDGTFLKLCPFDLERASLYQLAAGE